MLLAGDRFVEVEPEAEPEKEESTGDEQQVEKKSPSPRPEQTTEPTVAELAAEVTQLRKEGRDQLGRMDEVKGQLETVLSRLAAQFPNAAAPKVVVPKLGAVIPSDPALES